MPARPITRAPLIMPANDARIFPMPRPIPVAVSKDGIPVQILHGSGEDTFFYTTKGMARDWDGGIGAYHLPTARSPHTGKPPAGDALQNAADKKARLPPHGGADWEPRIWKQLVINTRSHPKFPVTYTHNGDPHYIVSRTSLHSKRLPEGDTARYVDATTVPYVVLPSNLWRGRLLLGDLATVYNERNGRLTHAIFADSGPKGHIGEGSIALSRALGVRDPDPITWVIFPGSFPWPPVWPIASAAVNEAAKRRFESWGGTLRIADWRVDLLLLAMDTLKVNDTLPPVLRPALATILSAQASLRASKGHPYPHSGADRDDAISELGIFIDRITALPSGSLRPEIANYMRELANRARKALSVPD